MNTIGWLMRSPSGGREVWALHGDVALYAGFDFDEVYQFAPGSGRRAAEEYLIQRTEAAEFGGTQLVNGPVEFDLTPEAIATIQSPTDGRWVFAPLLNKELTNGVKPPSVPAGGGIAWSEPIISFAPTPPTGVPIGSLWVDTSEDAPADPSVGSMHYDMASRMLKTFTGGKWTEVGYMDASGITFDSDGATVFG